MGTMAGEEGEGQDGNQGEHAWHGGGVVVGRLHHRGRVRQTFIAIVEGDRVRGFLKSTRIVTRLSVGEEGGGDKAISSCHQRAPWMNYDFGIQMVCVVMLSSANLERCFGTL